MAKPTTPRWEQANFGHHLKMGASVLAHVWEANGYGWMSLMSEGGKRGDLPPTHGPYESVRRAKDAAELGDKHHQIPTLKRA